MNLKIMGWDRTGKKGDFLSTLTPFNLIESLRYS